MTKNRTIDCIVLLSALVTFTGFQDRVAATPLAYHITDLGTLGGTFSQGQDINASGQVTGESITTASPPYRAFLWTPMTPNAITGTMHDLGTLGGSFSFGLGINASGQITGQSYTTGDAASHAFLYDGTLHDLGTLGGANSSGQDINDSGQVAGWSSLTGNATEHAFLYDGTLHDLGTLGGSSSFGFGVNASGQVAGVSHVTGDAAQHAFLYDGAMHDLGTLGGAFSVAYGINDIGQVTGVSALDVGESPDHAFLYDGTMHDLGTLGGSTSTGYDISNNGHVVGRSNRAIAGIDHAFLYTSDDGMVDLNSLIHSLSGWELEVAKAINNVGQITGLGYVGGEAHAFLLTPIPEPASLTLLLVASLFIVTARDPRAAKNIC